MTSIWARFNTLLLILVLLTLLTLTGMFAAGVLGGPLDPPGPVGETDSVRLPGTPIDGPAVITQPGHYYLTRNMSIPAGPNAGIQVIADDVTLDLGGFTITGVDPTQQIAIIVNGARVRISNGTLRNAVGVEAFFAQDLWVSGVAVYGGSSYAFRVKNGALVEDCTVSGVAEYGFLLEGEPTEGSRVVIRNCVIKDNGVAGVYLSQYADGVLIEGSSIKGNNTSQTANRGGIVILNADDVTVRRNDMGFNNYADVFVNGINNVIVENVISCPGSIVVFIFSVNTFAPVDYPDPLTNRTHRLGC